MFEKTNDNALGICRFPIENEKIMKLIVLRGKINKTHFPIFSVLDLLTLSFGGQCWPLLQDITGICTFLKQ